ncbi:MAG TPA: hypothetical protein VLT16_18195 [Candidatus Limnocylindrales bacterium]|nr:hypothetical protein [Candidatus Limnocylindrales bacterium]
MKITVKLMALCMLLGTLGFAQGAKKADDSKKAAATDTAKKPAKAKKAKKAKKAAKSTAAKADKK